MKSGSDSPHHRVGVIILVQRNARQAIAALKALFESNSGEVSFEAIVLLNGADGDTVSQVQRNGGPARVLTTIANLGFGGGCNFAARHTSAEYLAFLNDDTLVDAGWLKALVDHADSDASIGAVGSRIRFADGKLQEAGSVLWSDGSTAPVGRGLAASGGEWRFRRDVTYASACALLVRRRDFESVGGFDESFFPAYYEDVDLCLSLKAIGKRITFEPTAELVHFESQSTTSLFKSHLFRRNHRRLREKWKDALSAYTDAEPNTIGAIDRAVSHAWGKKARVLVIDDRLPDAGLGSGYGRTVELVADLAATPYWVSMYAAAGAPDGENCAGAFGVRVVSGSLEAELADANRHYDIAIVSRPHNYERFVPLIRSLQPDCRICYDVESLFYRRIEKQAQTESAPVLRKQLEREAEAGRLLEHQIARSVDRLVCISTDELEILEAVPGHAPIDFITPIARDGRITERTFHERRPVAVFVAGWMAGPNSPNGDALRWLAERVVPLIAERVPQAKLLVTGANPPEVLLSYRSPYLEFAGFVSDLYELYSQARVALSPVRFGAGVKIKAIEAIQHGVPVVATPVGAEGIAISARGAMYVSDDPRRFADEVVNLLTQPDAWGYRRTEALAQSESWRANTGKTWDDVCDAMMAERDADHARAEITNA